MKERAIIIVFIAPTRKRKFLGFECVFSESSEAKTAAWPEPIPGRKEEKGAIRAADKKDFKRESFDIFNENKGIIFWGGREVLLLIETRRAEVPKSPVRRGRRGWFIGRFNERKPRKPASRNTTREIRNSSSLKIK